MKTPESSFSSRQELIAAINDKATDKILELNAQYGDIEELQPLLESTVGRIRTEQLNFHNVHMDKILQHSTNTFEDVFDIFKNRVDIHCAELYETAGSAEKAVHESGVHTIREGVKAHVKKVA